jgi:diadenylate cyclase
MRLWDKIGDYLLYVIHSYLLWQVGLELLLIGFVIYSLIRFLRGTGGEKLFKGIAVLLLGFWGISLLTRVWHLDRIALLYNYFLITVLVVAAVAFQTELRRGLMRLGVTRFARYAAPEMQQVIEHIVDSAAMLSHNRIGALIAVERQVGLVDFIATGTRLDAEVTSDLLNTIFWPGTPLHDMGVVIRGGRLIAAGVQFPLAEHGEYDRLLGSRHRSAIGLSNDTDAVVVVVSEETGNIALAVDGQLIRFLTIEQLRSQLIDLIMPIVSKPGSFSWAARLWAIVRPRSAGPVPKAHPSDDVKTDHNKEQSPP